jgi:hypothetical protein
MKTYTIIFTVFVLVILNYMMSYYQVKQYQTCLDKFRFATQEERVETCTPILNKRMIL